MPVSAGRLWGIAAADAVTAGAHKSESAVSTERPRALKSECRTGLGFAQAGGAPACRETLWSSPRSQPERRPGRRAISCQRNGAYVNVSASRLFTPWTLRGVTARNRTIVSPMCEYSTPSGLALPWHLVHLGSRAVGGAGIVFTEAAAVTPEGRISADDLGIWSDEQRDALAPIAAFIREQGAVAGIQLAHAGRKGSTDAPWRGGGHLDPGQRGWQVVAPSPVPYHPAWPLPHALTLEEIAGVWEAFVAAAQRADQAGFDVVEIHAAHGYLLHQFLSPLSNQRRDEYGGTFENRTRLAREVVEAVRRAWPAHKPLFVRLSCTDWVDGGWDADQSVELARVLKHLGADAIDCSSGGLDRAQKIPVGPGYQVPFAERIRRESGIQTIAVGMITQAQQAEEIVASGSADAVALAREFLRDPFWPLHAAQELDAGIAWPVQYERARPVPVA
ncbi:NADH:flavin oxidoreductase/NADH oxidase [bacterium]|nr:MAG: NADH:flavin oxidoreductase/NADH oxidase [bacterium]